MKKIEKNVYFIPRDKDVESSLEHPKPSKMFIPQWYKDMPQTVTTIDGLGSDYTAKKCIPFLDSLTSGYTQSLVCDLEIINNGIDQNSNPSISYRWAHNFRPMSTRAEETNSSSVMPHFPGYYNAEFHWNSFWEPQTPPGYSTLYSHPFNRFDLPFLTLNAIIDTDKWPLTGPVPFLIKEGFSGIIPAGTPIYQMIFIKRDKWVSSKKDYDEKFQKSTWHNVRKHFKDGYKKEYWQKKEFL